MSQPAPRLPAWGEGFLAHREKHLGQPLGRDAFEQSKTTPIVQVLKFDNIFGGCRAFCSFEFSNHAPQVGEVADVFMLLMRDETRPYSAEKTAQKDANPCCKKHMLTS